jgi:hypothetical protein
LITVKDVEAGNYDLIVGHCYINLLNSTQNLNHDGQRSWSNQCKTLVSHIKQSDFDVYLVPFKNDQETLKNRLKKILGKSVDAGSEHCSRHDIYAVSPSYENYEKLEQLINKHGGISYNASLKIVFDNVCINR